MREVGCNFRSDGICFLRKAFAFRRRSVTSVCVPKAVGSDPDVCGRPKKYFGKSGGVLLY